MCKCYICDAEMNENEIQLGEDNKTEPCGTCMSIIMDTAYCNGFTPGGAEENSGELDMLEEDEE